MNQRDKEQREMREPERRVMSERKGKKWEKDKGKKAHQIHLQQQLKTRLRNPVIHPWGTMDSRLIQSNYSQTAWDGTYNFPSINGGNNVGPNHHEAPFSRTVKNPYKLYSVEDEIKLLHAVVIHGQKWKSIVKSFTGQSEEQLKLAAKWKHVIMAGTEMDKNKNRFHIFAAFVHVNVEERSIYKQKFQKWFEEMESDDGKIKANAEAWFRKVKNAPSSPLQN
ncbi:hypothetical protein LOK49_Contig525G00001 [Camellia lanceoleosa]|nr:hypothetical protein LOK49_Contig525G00001 [Camellia lanceoleosa]